LGFISGLSASLPPSNRLIFDGESAHIGVVRCPPQAADFGAVCTSKCYCFAFARSVVRIRPARGHSFIEDPTAVSFYNQGQEYARGVLSPRGDRCEWYGVAPSLVRDAVGAFDPQVAESDRLFRFSCAPVPASVYLRQRMLFKAVRRDRAVDPLFVEETIIELLNRVVQAAYPGVRRADAVPGKRAREIADAARSLLARRFSCAVSLRALAAELQTSVFHLCRVFRRLHGGTIHRYVVDLRLRAALEELDCDGADLATIAERLGFSHHSHFTSTFRAQFGAPPSVIRSWLQENGAACRFFRVCAGIGRDQTSPTRVRHFAVRTDHRRPGTAGDSR
jgi:AraC family transcriptional regulator